VAEDLTEGHADEPEEGAREHLSQREVGWHADPFGRYARRWFDGERWTASVIGHDRSAVQLDPVDVDLDVAGETMAGLRGIPTAFAGYLVGVLLSAAVAIWLDRSDTSYSLATELALSSLALWTGLVGTALVVSGRRGTGSLVRDFGLRFRWADLGFGLAGAIVGRVVAALSLLPLPLVDPDFGNENDRSLFEDVAVDGRSWVILAIVACVGAPLVEELFFRGLLQTRLVARLGVVWGIGIASVLFGAAHLIGWEGAPTAINAWAVTFGGMVLGATYHYSERLGAAIVAHSLFNAVALLTLWTLSA
jgi:membrane protease YdiL (CAAX protease family)